MTPHISPQVFVLYNSIVYAYIMFIFRTHRISELSSADDRIYNIMYTFTSAVASAHTNVKLDPSSVTNVFLYLGDRCLLDVLQ